MEVNDEGNMREGRRYKGDECLGQAFTGRSRVHSSPPPQQNLFTQLGKRDKTTHQWIRLRKQCDKILLLPKRQRPNVLPRPLGGYGVKVIDGGRAKNVQDD